MRFTCCALGLTVIVMDESAVLDDLTADLFNLDVKMAPVYDMTGSNTTTQCTDNGCTNTCRSCGCTRGC